ncbi:MAG: hypothetical protein EBR82_78640 [Caulobacteraceae bacterium]|nr:hypothetical protein [Caulobacteraceae bacterium]
MAGKPEGYQEVAERVHAFYATYPMGSIRTESVEFVQVAGKDYVLVKAAVYRGPDDPHPGTGTAMDPIPGTTPFTKGSEVENAETSSWGRALASIGLGGRKIATADEVAVKTAQTATRVTITEAQGKELAKLAADKGLATPELRKLVANAMQVPVAKARLLDLTFGEFRAVMQNLGSRP